MNLPTYLDKRDGNDQATIDWHIIKQFNSTPVRPPSCSSPGVYILVILLRKILSHVSLYTSASSDPFSNLLSYN